MANRFLNNIRINDEYTFPENDGSAGQAIVTDGSGNLSFGSAVASSADSTKSVHISVKNTSGSQILKGTPVYVTGETGNSGKIEIAPADASDSAKMPALGILESTLSNNAEGFCVQGGLLEGLATATIDGTSTTANDTVYVKAGGGLTMTKPTGSNLIQNIAKVARVHASNGSLVVSSILRTNDVPNLNTGKIWVGTATNTAESTVVHLDESNGRMGIGTASPSSNLHVVGKQMITTGANASPQTDDYLFIGGDGLGSANASIYIGNSGDGGGYGWRILYEGVGSGVNNKLKFRSENLGSSVDTITMLQDGKVGIGTTSPGYKLDVAGDIYISNSESLYLGDANSRISSNSSSDILYFPNRDHIFGSVISGADVERMRITEAGNVGIGETNPSKKLEVNGTVHLGSGGNDVSIGSSSSSVIFMLRAGYNYIQASSVSGQLVFRTGGPNNRMIIDSAGNVGIGTTSPGSRLHVVGANLGNTSGNEVTLANIKGVRHNLEFKNLRTADSADWNSTTYRLQNKVDTTNMQSIDFVTDASYNRHVDINTASNAFNTRFTHNGRVGIGTTNPAKKLDVAGEWILDGITGGHFENYEFGSQLDISELTSGGWARANRIVTSDSSAYVFSGVLGNDTTLTRAYWTIGASSNATGYTYNNGISLLPSGNVGIGTINPATKLVVSNGGASGLEFSPIGGVGNDAFIQAYNRSTSSYENLTYYANNHYFNYGSSTRMIIEAGGNVGIGTTSPSAKLDVEGRVDFASDIRLRGQDTSLNIGVVRLFVDATNNFFIDPGNAGTALSTFKSTGAIQLGNYGSGTYTGTATQRLAVDSGGNVIEIPIGSGPVDGSGTANYVTKWSDADTITNSSIYDNGSQVIINGTSSAFSDKLYLHNTSGYAVSGWRVGTAATYVGTLYNYSGVLALEADGTRSLSLKNTTNGEIVRIDGANSKVGIGTTSPLAKLDVISPDGSTHSLRLGRVDNGNYWHFNHAGNDLRISNSAGAGSDILLGVDSGSTDQGNRVGIGTATPATRLDVNGDINISTISNSYKINNLTVLNVSSTYTRLYNPEGAIGLYIGDSGDRSNYYDNNYHKFRSAGGGFSYGVWDSTGLGIGTTSPGSRLDVSSSGANGIVISRDTGTTSNSGRLFFETDTASEGVALMNGNGALQFRTGSDPGATSGTVKMILTGDGKLGVGTGAPDATLHVESTGVTAGGYKYHAIIDDNNTYGTNKGGGIIFRGDYNSSGAKANFAAIRAGKSNSNDGNANAYLSLFYGASGALTEGIRLDYNGNVGIGTTIPAKQLHIQSSDPTIRLQDSDGTDQWGQIRQTAANMVFTTRSGSSNGQMNFQTYDGTTTLNTVTLKTSNQVQFNQYGSGTYTGTATQRLAVDSSGNVIEIPIGSGPVDGSGTANYVTKWSDADTITNSVIYDNGTNVGIGTTSPDQTLHVLKGLAGSIASNNNAIITAENSQNGYLQLLVPSTNESGILFGNPSNAAAGAIIYNNTTTSTGLQFRTNGNSTKMVIDGSGNVGIGTASPSTKLHIKSADFDDHIVLERGSDVLSISPSGGQLLFEGGISPWNNISENLGRADKHWLEAYVYSIRSGGELQFKSNGDYERMRIDSSGKVGIGTTSPGTKLHVKTSSSGATRYSSLNGIDIEGAGVTGINILSPNDGYGRIYFGSPSSNTAGSIEYVHSSTVGDGYLILRAGASNTMYIKGGNVGLGTANPIQKLHVVGSGYINAGSLFIDSGQRLKWGNSNQWIEGTSDTSLEFSGGNGSTQMILTAGGNVGIGETNPIHKLHVVGNTMITGVTYTDYVQTYSGTSIDFRHQDASIVMRVDTTNARVGIGMTSPSYKLDVTGGARVGGKVSYVKTYGSLDTTGNAVAGITAGYNGAPCNFTFTCTGSSGGYQRIVYSCHCVSTTWNTTKVIDEGTNDFDIEASANGTTITFTFKSTSGTKYYSPTVLVEAFGTAINSTYA